MYFVLNSVQGCKREPLDGAVGSKQDRKRTLGASYSIATGLRNQSFWYSPGHSRPRDGKLGWVPGIGRSGGSRNQKRGRLFHNRVRSLYFEPWFFVSQNLDSPCSFHTAKETRETAFCCFRCNVRNSKNHPEFSSNDTHICVFL